MLINYCDVFSFAVVTIKYTFLKQAEQGTLVCEDEATPPPAPPTVSPPPPQSSPTEEAKSPESTGTCTGTS